MSEVPDDIAEYLKGCGIELEETVGGLIMHCMNWVSKDQRVSFRQATEGTAYTAGNRGSDS